ncbi:MAG: amine oxidoreductase [Deltaproteobacteria bacterium]|nr:MAG: amine oxidoreductase [Deltaproteobacteria bacterium]
MRIIIIGGGTCGLGAAWRLNELGHDDWALCERSDQWGGLAASFQDGEGFWWDFGGHVLFSHYGYFDRLMDNLFDDGKGWIEHRREAWIWMQERFVPYPLQNNIHRLPDDIYWECLEGIIDIQRNGRPDLPTHFGQWIAATFGEGLAKWFLLPYNFKVWACPVDQMDWSWVGERVSPVDLKEILKRSISGKEDSSWGPNAHFRFPRVGATGAIWRRMASKLPADKISLNKEIVSIDPRHRTVAFQDGTDDQYDILLSTMALTDMVRLAGLDLSGANTGKLKHSATHVVGLGIRGSVPDRLSTKCWIYFPEDNCPFYRATVFSNYSPENVPDSRTQWSLMLEVSESGVKPVDPDRVVEDVIQGVLNTNLVSSRDAIHHTWYRSEKKGYPTPSLERNRVLFPLLSQLESMGIYSRGRFGAWRYEVGNMDHSLMQGVEFANRMIASGEELTLWYPQVVNAMHPSGTKR